MAFTSTVRFARLVFIPPTHAQDVHDLVLHCIADAPPPNWSKSRYTCLLSSLSTHIDARPERVVHKNSSQSWYQAHSPTFSPPPLPTPATTTTGPHIPIAIPQPGNQATNQNVLRPRHFSQGPVDCEMVRHHVSTTSLVLLYSTSLSNYPNLS